MSRISPAVMAGQPGPAFGRPECKLVRAIHVLRLARKTWMPGIKPAMTKQAAIAFGEVDR